MMVTAEEFRIMALSVSATLLGVGALWALWQAVSWFIHIHRTVRSHSFHVRDFLKFMREYNAQKMAARLYPKVDSTPPLFLRPSEPPPLPTTDASDWLDDDDRPSAITHVKES